MLTPASSGAAVRPIGGAGFIPGIPHLGIPELQMSDAAVGVARFVAATRQHCLRPSPKLRVATLILRMNTER